MPTTSQPRVRDVSCLVRVRRVELVERRTELVEVTSRAFEASKKLDFEEIINAMGAYNESMMKAGVLLAGEGLSDPKDGFVVDFSGEKPIVTDGPYGETHELFNGFWMIEVSSKEEAAEWASRAPLGPGSRLEVRRIPSNQEAFADCADNEYIKRRPAGAKSRQPRRQSSHALSSEPASLR